MKSKTIRVMLALTFVALLPGSQTFSVQKPTAGNPLGGTSWQLVRYKDADEKIFTPDDKSKYTLKFERNGRISARVDCNTASSSWKVNAKGELQFGSWDRTTRKCGTASLHDVIVNEGQNVRNFEIKDGHLFLWGMTKGGYYELEPMR